MKARALLPDRLSHAEIRLLRSRRDLDRLEDGIQRCRLPAYYWNREFRARVRFVEGCYAQALLEYERACQVKPAAAAVAPAPPPAPPAPPSPALFHQSFKIHLKEGITTTQLIDQPNQAWLTDPPFAPDTLFCRQLRFVDGAVPEHYADIMRRHGIAVKPPPRGLFLRYHRDQFLALCRQEIETASEHLLEGEPMEVRPFI